MGSNLAISLIIGASVTGAVRGIKSLSNSLKLFRDNTLSTKNKLTALATQAGISLGSAASTLSALSSTVLAASKPAIAFESAMADVKKVVDFKTPEGFKNLSKDILELTRTLPMTSEELAAITASGGQLGVAEEDLKEFTTTIAKMSVAFDMSAEDSGDAMAKLANVYKIPIKEIGKLGDAINELSNSSPAKASDIVSTLGRIGGVAKQFGLTENAAAALANSFISLGKAPEVAGTAINGMLTKLMTADKGGKKFQAALASVGVSAKQLKADIAKNGEQALVGFLKKIQHMPKEKQMGILVDLFGLEYADDVAVLAGNVNVLEASLKTLQQTDEKGKPKYLGSMEREFAARAATTENSLKLLKNSFTEIAINIGSQFLPIINKVINKIRPLIYSITDWIAQHQELVAVIVQGSVGIGAGVAAILALNGAFSGVLAVFTAGKGIIAGVNSGVMLLTKLVRFNLPLLLQLGSIFGGKLLVGIKAATQAVLFLGSSLLRLGGLVLSFVGRSFIALAEFIGKTVLVATKLAQVLMGALFKGIMLAGKALLFLGRAMLTNPIGLAITAIALGAYLIYQYWQPIKAFFGDLWTNIKTFFNSGIGNITATILNWSPLGLFYKVFAGVLSWFGIDLPNNFTEFGKNLINGLVNGINRAWESAKQTVSELGDSVKNWFTEKLGIHSPSRVFMGYGENTVDGLVIGVAKSAMKVANAVSGMGEKMQQAMPKALSVPAIETALTLTNKLPQVTSVKTAQSTLSAKTKSIVRKHTVNRAAADAATAALTASYLPSSLRQSVQQKSKPKPLQEALQQRNVAVREQTKDNAITVTFNPTINVNGASGQGVIEQVQQGLQMSLREFEQMINRVVDQKMRRSY
ncbi:Phage-related minor tail protein [Gallibacterium anatis UMN179]|uniref:Phage-related minor tail protein n=1 Tax=Gallibacterium anatis (strain UMN179) TaxID=1005058 RepID=F4HC86_GALAU|nr:phage tail tape measure protein [Gallibacterium anatis]AEC17647.1 Phage-related minor tail protein [Gallibacterium anatis UMN179]